MKVLVRETIADAGIELLRGKFDVVIDTDSPLEEIVEVIQKVSAGKRHLSGEVATKLAEHLGDDPITAREIEVLRLIAEGNRNQDVARRLAITEETVKVHVRHIMTKLGAQDRTQAVAIGLRRGIIQL